MLAWGRDRMLAWTDGRLCVFDVASLAAVWSHESEKPHALLMDELDRPFWLSSHGLRNFGDEGGVTLWSLASATNTPVKVVRLGMYRENVGLFGAAAAADRWTTDLWFFTQEFHPWRIRVHATAVPVVGPIEAFGWDVRQGIAARGHRVTLGGGKTGEIQSHALHRFSTARDFNDWIASLSPGAEDDEVWALFSSRVLRLDVGRRGIPITGGFRITPIGFPIRVVASGNSVAVVTTNGVTVYDQRGRVRLPLVEFDRERKDMDVALSPEGDRLAVWTDLSLRMWDVKKRTSTPMRCR